MYVWGVCVKRFSTMWFRFHNLSTISYFLRKSNDPSPAPPARRESCFLRSANRRRSSAAVMFRFNVVVVVVVDEVVEFAGFAVSSLWFGCKNSIKNTSTFST